MYRALLCISWTHFLIWPTNRVFFLTRLTTDSQFKLSANCVTSMTRTTVLCSVGCQAMLTSPRCRRQTGSCRRYIVGWPRPTNRHPRVPLPNYVLLVARRLDRRSNYLRHVKPTVWYCTVENRTVKYRLWFSQWRVNRSSV